MVPEQINIKDVLRMQMIDGCSLELCVAIVVSSATEIKSTLHDSFCEQRGEGEKNRERESVASHQPFLFILINNKLKVIKLKKINIIVINLFLWWLFLMLNEIN